MLPLSVVLTPLGKGLGAIKFQTQLAGGELIFVERGMLKAVPEQTAETAPIVSNGMGLIVIQIVSFAASHGPAGSLVVMTNPTIPFVMSAALGVQAVVNELELAKVPEPKVVQVALVAAPPIVAFNV